MSLRVLHLVGSAVNDFYCDLSRLYARDCIEATRDPDRFEPVIAYVTPDGDWRFPDDLSQQAIASAEPKKLATALGHLAALDADVAIPQMFCLPGMTRYRALLELLEIPYLGNTPDVMAIAANKAWTRSVVAGTGVDVPRGELLDTGEEPSLEPPVIVKPVDADNSLGVSLVRDPTEYESALRAAFGHADRVLVESYVDLGREVRCGILVEQGRLVCLPLEEYGPATIRTPSEKITRDQSGELKLMAKDHEMAWIVDRDDPLTERVWKVARQCHRALDCRHYSLFDFRIDPSGRPWFLEAGLFCSFAEQSVLSTMARASGRSTVEIFEGCLRDVGLVPG